MTSIPMWILAIFAVGAVLYLYYTGGMDDLGENLGIAFVFIMFGVIVGGIFL